jgi:hypothetical protein
MKERMSLPIDHGTEKHFSPQQLAERWNFSVKFVRDLFRNKPGVVISGKQHKTIRVPESAAVRMYARASARPI